MQLLATLPNVYLKISSFGYIDPDWEAADKIIESVIATIKVFTPQRCMFGSNFPEENTLESGSWTMKSLVKVFLKISESFT
jgi:predicted TIM-barrel fold metal-dependent hydrolase